MALQAHAAPVGDGAMADAALELRDLLNRMLIEDLKSQETEAIAQAMQTPARWRATGSCITGACRSKRTCKLQIPRYRSRRGRYLCTSCW